MTAVKIGDHVRVDSFEGVVSYLNGNDRIDVQVGDANADGTTYVEFIPADLVTVIEPPAPPVAVGDTIATVEALAALPPGTVVLSSVGNAVQRRTSGRWYEAASHADSVAPGLLGPVTVLHLGDQS
jgi:hypothetical protein